jgi:hypothetical protein
MNCRILFSLFLNFLCVNLCCSQKIDNTAFYRDVSSGRSFRVHYENDFFSRSDIYYTQGINLEYYNPTLEKPFRRLLLRLPYAKTNYGIAAEHLGFTPTSISSPSIRYGDRPFAACLMAKVFSISNDSIRNVLVSSTFSLSIIGPGAGGKQFQSAIHRWINDRQPMGWNNQIHNDIILNYNAGIAKGLVNLRWLTVAGKVSADLGTLDTKVNTGVIVMTGLFKSRWSDGARRKFQAYVYAEPVGSLIGYDATLQGGIFNDASAYTISARDITRTVFQNNSGIIFIIRKLQLEYFQSFNTKEFASARSHHWGGVRVGLKL